MYLLAKSSDHPWAAAGVSGTSGGCETAGGGRTAGPGGVATESWERLEYCWIRRILITSSNHEGSQLLTAAPGEFLPIRNLPDLCLGLVDLLGLDHPVEATSCVVAAVGRYPVAEDTLGVVPWVTTRSCHQSGAQLIRPEITVNCGEAPGLGDLF